MAYRCNNLDCPKKLEGGILHFASRLAMDIEGLGEAVVSQLIEKKLIKDLADIYYLKKEDLLSLYNHSYKNHIRPMRTLQSLNIYSIFLKFLLLSNQIFVFAYARSLM